MLVVALAQETKVLEQGDLAVVVMQELQDLQEDLQEDKVLQEQQIEALVVEILV